MIDRTSGATSEVTDARRRWQMYRRR